ncbi:MAG: hypothetical protein QOE43_2214 [Gaiellaceae bacterium]|nr:hypothetical protein [Gaiellaceae bacterium]
MTRRAWTILVVGALLSVSLGGFVLLDRGQASVFKPLASGGVFTPAVWETVKQRIAQRGLNPASVSVLTSAGDSQSAKALALLGAARPSGANCFIVARGTTLGASICRLAKPVTVFTARDQFYEIGASGQGHAFPATDAIGLIRRDVASVVMRWKISGRPNVQGLPLFDVPGGRAFGFTFRGRSGTLLVRDAQGKTVSRLDLAPR